MLNGFQCRTAAVSNAAYDGADSIVIFLCKECIPALGRLQLPAAVEQAVRAYLKAYDDVYEAEALHTLVLPVENGLLTVL
ncbi:hypothetical protein, partial [uncultured Phascolarctobacterium sp.]